MIADRWTLLVRVFTGLEADTTRAALELHGIPVLVRGSQMGMFGSAFQGPVLGGIDVLVPETVLDRAREIAGIESP